MRVKKGRVDCILTNKLVLKVKHVLTTAINVPKLEREVEEKG